MSTVEQGANFQHYELAIPYEGVVDEVFTDLLTDKRAFIRSAMEKVREENSTLLPVLIRLIPSVDWETQLSWCLAYYEIHRRSAERAKIPMIRISKDTVDSLLAQELAENNLFIERDEKALTKYFYNKDRLQKERQEKEITRSKEFENFWSYLVVSQAYLISHQHLSSSAASERIQVAYDLQEIFLAQEDINNLNRSFPN